MKELELLKKDWKAKESGFSKAQARSALCCPYMEAIFLYCKVVVLYFYSRICFFGLP